MTAEALLDSNVLLYAVSTDPSEALLRLWFWVGNFELARTAKPDTVSM